MIASIEGAKTLWRFKPARTILPIWLLLCAYTTNVAWSPSQLNDANYAVWSQPNPRHDSLREALTYIPDDAAVSASYQLLPHLAHREHIYDWPNPFWASVWGNDDCAHLPDPTTIDYVAIDRSQIGATNQTLFDDMIEPGGPFDIVFEDDNVVVAKRVGTTPEVDVRPQADSCQLLAARHGSG
jgi:hypothetical protein